MRQQSSIQALYPHADPSGPGVEAGLAAPHDEGLATLSLDDITLRQRGILYRQILFVGPVSLDIEQLQTLLQAKQYSAYFDHVDNATQALERLLDRKRPRPRAIVLSRRVPGAAPHELLNLLRARRELRAIPVFAYDATHCPDASRRLYANGANGYLCGDAAAPQLAAALLQFETLADLQAR